VGLIPILSAFNQPDTVGLPTREIREQGDVNCCVSCALAAALEGANPASPALAPLYHFFFAGGRQALESGLTIAQAQGALLRRGMCARALHPFAIAPANVGDEPTDEAVRDGMGRRPIDPESGTLLWKPLSLAGPLALKRLLAAGIPAVMLFQPNNDYFALKPGRPVLASNGPPYSATSHAAAVIGYSNADAVFVVQDSRGLSFGVDGQWFLPYDLLASPFVVSAFALAPE
jgi:hypothetical protein